MLIIVSMPWKEISETAEEIIMFNIVREGVIHIDIKESWSNHIDHGIAGIEFNTRSIKYALSSRQIPDQ